MKIKRQTTLKLLIFAELCLYCCVFHANLIFCCIIANHWRMRQTQSRSKIKIFPPLRTYTRFAVARKSFKFEYKQATRNRRFGDTDKLVENSQIIVNCRGELLLLLESNDSRNIRKVTIIIQIEISLELVGFHSTENLLITSKDVDR